MGALKRTIYLAIYIALIFSGFKANAQAVLIEKALTKLELASNFSYQYTLKLRQYNTDTVITSHKHLFSRNQNDENVGFRYRLESRNERDNSHTLETYSGVALTRLNMRDSTYQTGEPSASVIHGSLLGYLRMLKNLANKNPVVTQGDTVINTVSYARFMIISYDTIINDQHFYTRISVTMNKNTSLPGRISTISRNRNTADAVTNYYSSFDYSAFLFDQENIDPAFSTSLTGYKMQVDTPVLPLLKPGQSAPDWTLYDAENKPLSLSSLKGKVVLLNFFFIGCEGGMVSLKPLNNLHHKYKGKNFAVISISDRDSRKMIQDFKKSYQMPFPMYGDAKGAFDAYHVSVSPTFYFIGKDGKITQVVEGYNDNFESKADDVINGLLRNKGFSGL